MGDQRLRERFGFWLTALLALAYLGRVVYVLLQRTTDPYFARPLLDGAYYVEWARSLLAGEGPAGAFYLAPLYPYLLAPFIAVFGENFALLYLLQHLAVCSAAALLALVVRPRAGEWAALATAALIALHHPLVFFASRPLGEPLALLLLAASLLLAERENDRSTALAGIAAGLATIVRPNLLLIPLIWAATEASSRRFRSGALLLAGTALVIAPVALRNFVASGHPVPVSSNSGMTFYHGNGPGARGTFTLPSGFSGTVRDQAQEATVLARARSGLELDVVEADRWWGRQAVRTRLADPLGSLGLVARRAWLLFDNHEHSLDYHPLLDTNPARLTLRFGHEVEIALVPFAALFGLALVGIYLGGIAGSGGSRAWAAIVACALTPILFYVSSRYRLPCAALLAIPAGCGLAALARFDGTVPRRRRAVAAALLVGGMAFSLTVPSGLPARAGKAAALANRVTAYKELGNLAAAERDARRAIAVAPELPAPHYSLGIALLAAGQAEPAELAFRQSLERDPAYAPAAGDLAGLLIRSGRPAEAVPLLERTLAVHVTHQVCWTNLVIALWESGRQEPARHALLEAQQRGVELHPELVRQVLAPPPEPPPELK